MIMEVVLMYREKIDRKNKKTCSIHYVVPKSSRAHVG